MAIVEPGKGRAVIEQDGAGLRITIPPAMRIGPIILLGAWLIFWIAGETRILAISLAEFAGEPSVAWSFLMLFWLAAWTLMGVWVSGLLLWQLSGKEIIEVNSMMLKRRKRIPLFSRSREYALANVINLRTTPPLPWSFWFYRLNLAFLSFNDGAISFECGSDTHYLASGLEEADAKYVIKHMRQQVKSLSVAANSEQYSASVAGSGRNWPIIEDDGSSLRIIMPVACPPFISIVMGGFLVVWIFAEFSAVAALLNGAPLAGQHFTLPWMTDETSTGPDFFYLMLSWLACGAVISVLFAGLFLWSVAGKEVIAVNSTTLRRIWQMPVFSYSREYSIANITDLRPAPLMLPLKYNGQKVTFLKFVGGAIIFDYGRSTHYLGLEMDEVDARYAIEEMCKRVKSLCQ